MTRWLAGLFDPRGTADHTRVAEALAPHPASVFVDGPLRVAYSGDEHAERQPLSLLDGFLDDHSELAAELQISPRASPEQLLASAWQRWGTTAMLARLRGDFAIVLWDRLRGEGVIARDQLGVRTMFLHETSGAVYFASEVRLLLAMLPRRPAPDPITMAHWLAMSNRPGSATLYEGVRRLEPGSALTLTSTGVHEHRYWEPRFGDRASAREHAPEQEVRAALARAVNRRLDSTAPTGVLMSGGLDSASVAAVAASEAAGSVIAYSGVFPDHPVVDESALIGQIRGRLGLAGIDAEVHAGGLLASAVDAVEAWEMPLLGWGDFWTLPLLRQAAAEGVRITLGGDGGDEVFGARTYLLADEVRGGHPLAALRLVRELPGAGDDPARRQIARIALGTALLGALPYRPHDLIHRPFARRERPPWMRRAAGRNLIRSDDPLAWKRLDGPRWWAHIAHGLTRGIEATGVFEHQRRRAASAGLQARHPLLDLDVVELALAQPPLATFNRYRNRPVLRAAMAGMLPDEVRLRPQKAWFDTLLVDCMMGADGPSIHQLLTSPDSELRAYVHQDRLQREMFGSEAGRASGQFKWLAQVWRLLTAECWLRAQADPGTGVLRDELALSEPRIHYRRVSAPPTSS